MTIIWSCGLSVEEHAAAGKEVAVPRPCCPRCGSAMMFWSGCPRWVRAGTELRIWVKRCRCRSCHRSDAMLPSFCLVGRLDCVEVIGPALVAVSKGAGVRRVAQGIGELFAYTTVRAWWRRHRERSGWLAGVVSAALARGVSRGGDRQEADVLAQLGSVGAEKAGALGIGVWAAVSLLSGGAWLWTTTNVPMTAGDGGRLMAVMASCRSRMPP